MHLQIRELEAVKKNEIKITSKRNLCARLSFYLWFLLIENEKNNILRVLPQFVLLLLNLAIFYFIFQSYNQYPIVFIHTSLCMFLGQLRFDFLIFLLRSPSFFSFFFCFFFLLLIASFWKKIWCIVVMRFPVLLTFWMVRNTILISMNAVKLPIDWNTPNYNMILTIDYKPKSRN